MKYLGKIFILAVTVVILTLSLALAGAKFSNKDTAQDRQDSTFGTDPGDDTSKTTFKKTDRGDTSIKSKAAPKKEPVDWYDKIIITVNPETRWPKTGSTSTSTTQTKYDNATDTETTTSTTTTQEIK